MKVRKKLEFHQTLKIFQKYSCELQKIQSLPKIKQSEEECAARARPYRNKTVLADVSGSL